MGRTPQTTKPTVRLRTWDLLRQAVLMFLLVAPSLPALAQIQPRARIGGTVTDVDTGEPLPSVHVFISKSMIGAVTDVDGHYLMTLPLGAHRIVVSMVGFVSQTHDVMVREPRQYALDFTLREEIIPVGEVIVLAERDEKWDDYLKRFTSQFIGETDFSRDIRIVNPEVLDFREEDGRFIAETDVPIFLVNRAVGYRIEHHLHKFFQEGDETWQDGESFFEELEPSDAKESERWARNREEAFHGSAQHFFLSLVRKSTLDEGFVVFAVEDPVPVGESDPYVQNQAAPFRKPHFAVNPAIYLSDGQTEREFTLDFNNYLEVVYTREPEDGAYGKWQRIYHSGEARPFQHSWIRLQSGPVTLDNNGNVVNPYGIAYFGYMAFERLADLLPKEYRPQSF